MSCNGGYVLVVEDDASIRDGLASLIADWSHEVRTAHNGRAALGVMGEGRPPSVILLDLMMPVMDGAAFLAEKHTRPAWANIPVYVMSANIPREMPPGVLSVLRKPFDLEALTSIIDRHC
jgi:CheY-like chemotaxis protein